MCEYIGLVTMLWHSIIKPIIVSYFVDKEFHWLKLTWQTKTTEKEYKQKTAEEI